MDTGSLCGSLPAPLRLTLLYLLSSRPRPYLPAGATSASGQINCPATCTKDMAGAAQDPATCPDYTPGGYAAVGLHCCNTADCVTGGGDDTLNRNTACTANDESGYTLSPKESYFTDSNGATRQQEIGIDCTDPKGPYDPPLKLLHGALQTCPDGHFH